MILQERRGGQTAGGRVGRLARTDVYVQAGLVGRGLPIIWALTGMTGHGIVGAT